MLFDTIKGFGLPPPPGKPWSTVDIFTISSLTVVKIGNLSIQKLGKSLTQNKINKHSDSYMYTLFL